MPTKIVPVPSEGSHVNSRSDMGKACIMEMVDYVYNPNGYDVLTDQPECSSSSIAHVAAAVNDALPDSKRHLIMKDFDRLFGTAGAERNKEFVRQMEEFVVRSIQLDCPDQSQESILAELNDWNGYYETCERFLSNMDDHEEIAGVLTQVLDIYDEVFGPRVVPEHDLSVFYKHFNFKTAAIELG